MAICGFRSFRVLRDVIRVLLLLTLILIMSASIYGAIDIDPEITGNMIEIDGETTEEIIIGTPSVKSITLLGSGFGLGCISWGLSRLLAYKARKRADNLSVQWSDLTQHNRERISMESDMDHTCLINPLYLCLAIGALYGSYLLAGYNLAFAGEGFSEECIGAFFAVFLAVVCTIPLGFLLFLYSVQAIEFLDTKYEWHYIHEEPQVGSPNYRDEPAQVNLAVQQPPEIPANAEMFEPSREDSPSKSDEERCAVCLNKKRPNHKLWKFRCNHTYHEPCYNCVTREDGERSKCPECRTIGPAGPVVPQPSAPPLSPSVSVAPVGAEVVQID